MLLIALSLALTGAVAADAETAPKPDKPVCRSVGRTGTLFATRVCHTPAEWAAIDAGSQAEADKLRDAMRRGDNRTS